MIVNRLFLISRVQIACPQRMYNSGKYFEACLHERNRETRGALVLRKAQSSGDLFVSYYSILLLCIRSSRHTLSFLMRTH